MAGGADDVAQQASATLPQHLPDAAHRGELRARPPPGSATAEGQSGADAPPTGSDEDTRASSGRKGGVAPSQHMPSLCLAMPPPRAAHPPHLPGPPPRTSAGARGGDQGAAGEGPDDAGGGGPHLGGGLGEGALGARGGLVMGGWTKRGAWRWPKTLMMAATNSLILLHLFC